jgi:hypothetical protein
VNEAGGAATFHAGDVEPAPRVDDAKAPVDRGNIAQCFVGYRRDHQNFNVTD